MKMRPCQPLPNWEISGDHYLRFWAGLCKVLCILKGMDRVDLKSIKKSLYITFCTVFSAVAFMYLKRNAQWIFYAVRPNKISEVFIIHAISKFGERGPLFFVIFHKFVIHFCVKFESQRLSWQTIKTGRPIIFLLSIHCSTPHALSSKKICAMCL